MHGSKIVRFATIQHAKNIYQYKKIKEKLYKTHAAIWYNKLLIWMHKRIPLTL